MKICVLGLWHLGTVTAGCLAAAGHTVCGLDFDSDVIAKLSEGTPPIFEPGLEDLIHEGIRSSGLSFTADPQSALNNVDLLWVAYDTPVDEDDNADVGYVLERVERVLKFLPSSVLVLISSQLPAGSTRQLENSYRSMAPTGGVTFAYSPENLRLGKAITAFTKPERVIIGVRSDRGRALLQDVFGAFTDRIEWMSVESAEMTKHALNAFLATSIGFINEIAVLCEAVGADAREVERGLKSEGRIGPRAYLSPGGAFAGGTLARDIAFLSSIGARQGIATHLLRSVRTSNDAHREWPRRKLESVFGDLRGKTIAVWGLTYKPGTDTLRRSAAMELCAWLKASGAHARAHDPAVKSLPGEAEEGITLCATPLDAIRGAHALVVATEWPEYKEVSPSDVASAMRPAVVLDVGRFLAATLESNPDISYFTVGKP